MKNLDQIRAKNALSAALMKSGNKPHFTRTDVAGFPALIIQNGLLAAFAYAAEEGKTTRDGIRFACDKTTEHLADEEIGISVLKGKTKARGLVESLSSNKATCLDLQRATAEALQFFGYLKRFAEKKD